MTHPRSFEPAGATVTGYDRAVLERYFAAVDAERRRLHAEIAAARGRVARARAALDSRRVLVGMLERTVDEITAKRRQADLVVGRIVQGSSASAVEVASSPVPAVGSAAPVDAPWQWDPPGSGRALVHDGAVPSVRMAEAAVR